ncbi:acid sphingomyelinase-like phosphodiesterase 3b isoform X2 [Haliotis rufescens]|uniref:acid sphingomyelinase-like phosphodiesterase 3b isoform X2 n=1 Tax=Haliotis rufescens TaxID=6454 RepID=UPI00201F1F99|nr:acid sphingomyelinase-like phosphodiesterase 3b isoform X2 [Haliotis rufescens]
MAAVRGWQGTLLILFIVGASKANEGYFWHITDHHYDTTYWSEMRSCNDEVPVRGIYGDYWCDSPWRLVNDSINAMANINRNVDFILWTGDNVAHIADQYTNETYVVHILRSITDALKAAFPGVKVYATMGNHDWYPSDQFPVDSHSLYNATADLWKDWIGDTNQVENFRKGAYYTVKTTQGLRIIGLNTNLYYTSDKLTTDMTDPAGQFAWLEEVLKNAKTAGEKVLMTAHVPPGFHVPGKVQWFYNHYNTRFLDISRTFSDIIVGMFFGHDHADGFKLLQRHGGSPGVPIFMAPSITPWRFKIPDESGDPHNPAIRLVKYNQQTGVLLDIHQYYMNLTDSNRNNASDWKIEYKASEEYGQTDLSAVSVDNIIKAFKTDKSLLDKYIRYNTVLANGDTTVNACDEKCRAEYNCAFINMNEISFDSCYTTLVGGSARLCSSSFLIVLLAIIYYVLF